ncbi:ZIP-like iron-zinc transporter [Panus rudis PR-1116 ss-1]|nr:ZIP-like iron-zinc transporter [Panus rudis PR-1116 ss-1]
MSGFLGLLGMSAVLGISSFAVGSLPLFFTFSRTTLAKLSTFGTGLLLGTALGVIVPEGVETIVLSDPDSPFRFPTRTIALSLLSGFKFMLIVERIIHRRTSHHHVALPSQETHPPEHVNGHVEFDVELGELERTEGLPAEPDHANAPPYLPPMSPSVRSTTEGKVKAYPVTLGLMIHALADGLALGSSALSNGSAIPSGLSIVIFLALIVHKAPVALALSTSLLSTSLSRAECRKHIAVFSASTPLGAIISYAILTLLDFGRYETLPGIALLFSGGTFLYVATVLQPGRTTADELNNRTRLILTIVGMIIPTLITSIFGDVH